jgi:hypothetical protein
MIMSRDLVAKMTKEINVKVKEITEGVTAMVVNRVVEETTDMVVVGRVVDTATTRLDIRAAKTTRVMVVRRVMAKEVIAAVVMMKAMVATPAADLPTMIRTK